MLEEQRKRVLEACRQAEKFGLCGPGSGNFSEIDRSQGLVAITPHNTDRSKMSWRDVLVMDLDGNVVDGSKDLKPTSETHFHIDIYKARKDITAISHTHAPHCCVFAALGLEVKPIIFKAMNYKCKCPLAPFAEPNTVELGKTIIDTLGEDGLACIMEKHGAITVSPESIEHAVRLSLYVEETATCYYRALQLIGLENKDKLAIDQDLLDEYMSRRK